MLILAFYIFGMKNYEISEEVRHDFVYGRQEVLFALSHNPRPLDQSDYAFYKIIILLFFFYHFFDFLPVDIVLQETL